MKLLGWELGLIILVVIVVAYSIYSDINWSQTFKAAVASLPSPNLTQIDPGSGS